MRLLSFTLAFLLATGSLLGHHAFGSLFDATRMLRHKGVIVAIAKINPHSLIFVDSTDANGVVEHWALEVAAARQLVQRGLGDNVLKPGAKIEFCGYRTKDGIDPRLSYRSQEPISLSLKSIPRPVYSGLLIAPEWMGIDGKPPQLPRDSKCQ
jgi:hypothetical protein